MALRRAGEVQLQHSAPPRSKSCEWQPHVSARAQNVRSLKGGECSHGLLGQDTSRRERQAGHPMSLGCKSKAGLPLYRCRRQT